MGLTEDNWGKAQFALTGAALIDPAFVVPTMAAETSADDFDGTDRAIYEAIIKLHRENRTVDVVSVLNELGPAYKDALMIRMRETPTAANFADYITICKEQARLLRIQKMANEVIESVTLQDARSVLGRMQELTVENKSRNISGMMDTLSAFFDIHQGEPKEYVKFGLEKLDKRLSVDLGDVVVIGGYPSDGKSALMSQMAYHMAARHKVGIFSFETSAAKLEDRLISHVCQIDISKIKHSKMDDTEWAAILDMQQEITARRLEFIEAAGMSANDVIGATLSRGYEVIFLDYIQLVTPEKRKGGTRNEEVAAVSMALHTLAQRHKVLVVELSQLRRTEKHGGEVPPPTLSSLRESGQLEQDADVVIFVYRKDQTKKNEPRKIFVAKNKDGDLGQFDLAFNGSTMTFSEDLPKKEKAPEKAKYAGRYPSELIDAQKKREAAEKSGETYNPFGYRDSDAPPPEQQDFFAMADKFPNIVKIQN